MKYKAVLFDLDGTLVDTIHDISHSMNSVLRQHGLNTHSTDEYKYFVGNGMRNLVINAIPEEKRNVDFITLLFNEMQQEYSKHWSEKSRLYDGIPELLDSLSAKKIKMSILSNKPHNFTIDMVKALLPQWNFEAILGERASVPRKPNPAAALEIAGLTGVGPEEFLFVGDSGVDMQTASSAGMHGVGALWGFRSRDELVGSGAKSIIAKPCHLLEFL